MVPPAKNLEVGSSRQALERIARRAQLHTNDPTELDRTTVRVCRMPPLTMLNENPADDKIGRCGLPVYGR